MQQSEWPHRLAHDDLDKTITLTFLRIGSWMGLRVQELFQLTWDGSFLWEWEDVYLHIPYQKQMQYNEKDLRVHKKLEVNYDNLPST